MVKIFDRFNQNQKRLIVFFHDALMAVVSYPLALMLRFGSLDPQENYTLEYWDVILIAGLIKVITFYFSKISRGIWKFSSTPDLMLIFKAVSLSSLTTILAVFFWNRLEGVPRSSFIIDWFNCIFLLGGSRFAYRIWKEGKYGDQDRIKTLIIGAGDAAEQLIRDIKRNPKSTIYVCGFIDNSKLRHNRTIHGVPILGSIENLSEVVEKTEATNIFIALPDATGKELRKITEICLGLSLNVKTLPALKDIADGRIQVSHLRPVNVEDLLGRKPVELDLKALGAMLTNKSILVTGAGGSIGSELCHQIAKFNPHQLILFESCEYFIYKKEMELRETHQELRVIPIVGDVKDEKRVREVMEKYRPEIVFHAAAYKHVPMMEYNPREAVKTNIMGTMIVSKAAVEFNVDKMVMISTDKAVNPTNIMGATKRIAEMVVLEQQEQGKTHFVTVRFGNVLGSTGSVIPRFMKQIEDGGPITVTHPEITRYFMSIPEATQLVLQAGCLGNGGEIFVLDMGEPVRIVDLAKDLINLSGYTENDIEIKFTGLRPGEKLYEEVLADEESTLPTSHDMVRVAQTRQIPGNFNDLLAKLFQVELKDEEIRPLIKELVQEYTPSPGESDNSDNEIRVH